MEQNKVTLNDLLTNIVGEKGIKTEVNVRLTQATYVSLFATIVGAVLVSFFAIQIFNSLTKKNG